jgi:hypothetical protein
MVKRGEMRRARVRYVSRAGLRSLACRKADSELGGGGAAEEEEASALAVE